MTHTTEERKAYAITKQTEMLEPLTPYLNDLTNLNPARTWAGEADRARAIDHLLAIFSLNKREAAEMLASELTDAEADPALVTAVKGWLAVSDAEVWRTVNGTAFGTKLATGNI